jgi:hypothetical protein
MRGSNRGLRAVTALVAVVLVAGCGAAASTPAPGTSGGAPLVTPDPHLTAPAHVDDVFRLLGSAGIRIIPNTASEGTTGDPVKRITATYTDWPLVLTEFSSASALRRVGGFDPSEPPRRGEAPYILAGLNILVEYGARNTNDPAPVPADAAHLKALMALVAALDPLLGPLSQRSVQPIALPGVTPAPPTAAPASASASPAS